MVDLQDPLNLASRLKDAEPIEAPKENTEINLSSTYLSSVTWSKSDAFLNDATIEKQLSTAEAAKIEAKQKATASGLNLWRYDPQAEEKAKAMAMAKARQIAEAEEKAKARAAQKEKLLQFLKWQSAKDRKLWYSRWVLSGIMLTLCLVLCSTVIFRDEVVKFLSQDLVQYIWSTSYAANILWLAQDDTIRVNPIVITDEADNNELEDEENTEDIEQPAEEVAELSEENVEPSEENTSEEPAELSDEENTEDLEQPAEEVAEPSEENLEPSDARTFTMVHVNNVELANWVMAPNCNTLACWDYTQVPAEEIVLCAEFRQKADLEDDDIRIWSTWMCRYKDESELVYLSLE